MQSIPGSARFRRLSAGLDKLMNQFTTPAFARALAGALVLVHAWCASGTLLLFDKAEPFTSETLLDQAYGDQASGSPRPGFGYLYGWGGGWTPHISVAYSAHTMVYDSLSGPGGDYGDLREVIYRNPAFLSGEPAAPLTVTLRADQGYQVTLSGFDLAAFNLVSGVPEPVTIAAVRVRDQQGRVAGGAEFVGVTIPDEAMEAGVLAPTHLSYTFDPPLRSRQLTIEIDVSVHGGAPDEGYVALDNVRFNQVEDVHPIQAAWHVDPARGSDANDGTATAPFRSLARAQAEVRAHNASMTGDLVVVLHGGLYELAAPIEFTGLDSGSGGWNVVYQAAPGEKPLISGGRAVTGWTVSTNSSPHLPTVLWEAPNDTGAWYTRQLFVNKTRAARARGPAPAGMRFVASGYTTTNGTPARAMAAWGNHQDIEFIFANDPVGVFAESHICVESILESGLIQMKQPAWTNVTQRAWDMMTCVSFPPSEVENAFELLDEPGEWFLARNAHPARGVKANTFYYAPRPGETLCNVTAVAPVLETLVKGQGTAAQPIRNLWFRGLQFSHATWLQPGGNLGFPEVGVNTFNTNLTKGLPAPYIGGVQTNAYGDWEMAPGHVGFEHAEDLRFERCTFTHLGGVALHLGRGLKYSEIVECVFTDISGNAIQLGTISEPRPSAASLVIGNQVRNCHIYKVACEFRGGVAIFAPYSQETKVLHNLVEDLPYCGMVFGGGSGWHHSVVPNVNRNLLLAHNRVKDTMQVLLDGGGVYLQSWQGSSLADGAVADGNLITDVHNKYFALYTDQGARFIRMRNNALFDNPALPDSEWGGCADTQDTTPPRAYPYPEFPMGDIDFQHNFEEKPGPAWYCNPTAPANVLATNNIPVRNETDIRNAGGGWILDHAGLEPHALDLLPPKRPRSVGIRLEPDRSVTLVLPTTWFWDYRIGFVDAFTNPWRDAAVLVGTGGVREWNDDPGSATNEPPGTPETRFYRVTESRP